jgi:hypothetical protein
MTREETLEAISTMQHFIDGGKVEVKDKSIMENWGETSSPAWNFKECQYRPKQKPEYVPFEGEELLDLIGKPIRSKTDRNMCHLVTSVYTTIDQVYLGDNSWVGSVTILERFEFLDGSPIGKLKE